MSNKETIKDADITIVIPAYGDSRILFESLGKLVEAPGFERCKLLIVNDCCPDEDYKAVAWFYNAKLISTPVNCGQGLARMYGLSKADTPYVMFMDQDDWYTDIESLYQEMMKDPENCVCAMGSASKREGHDCGEERLMFSSMWGKLWNKRYLPNEISTPKVSRYQEDAYFSKIMPFWAAHISHDMYYSSVEKEVYHWTDNKASQTEVWAKDEEHFIYVEAMFCIAMLEAYDFVKRNVPEQRELFRGHLYELLQEPLRLVGQYAIAHGFSEEWGAKITEIIKEVNERFIEALNEI